MSVDGLENHPSPLPEPILSRQEFPGRPDGEHEAVAVLEARLRDAGLRAADISYRNDVDPSVGVFLSREDEDEGLPIVRVWIVGRDSEAREWTDDFPGEIYFMVATADYWVAGPREIDATRLWRAVYGDVGPGHFSTTFYGRVVDVVRDLMVRLPDAVDRLGQEDFDG